MLLGKGGGIGHTIRGFSGLGILVRLVLAPMEGLLDAVLRNVLTRTARYDWAVTEFARVSDSLLPHRCYLRISPELEAGGLTAGGTPVRVQLLGSDVSRMADNAAHLALLSPPGIDLNFGCPAPTVNRHRGGAILLDEPETLFAIVSAVRQRVPASIPFTAKMRLGVSDKEKALDCARALADGGVDEIVVHARTRLEGYRPPAHWGWVGRVAESVRVPVIANGDVWCEDDWVRCRAESGVADVMLGRGAVADPFLAHRIRGIDGRGSSGVPTSAQRGVEWAELCPLIAIFWSGVKRKVESRHAPGRVKQWLNHLKRNYAQAEALFLEIRLMRHPSEIDAALARHGITDEPFEMAA